MVRLATTSEVFHMYAVVEGKAVSVADGACIVIEVMPHLSLIEEPAAECFGAPAGHRVFAWSEAGEYLFCAGGQRIIAWRVPR